MISNQKEHIPIHVPVTSFCVWAQVYTWQDVKMGLSTSLPPWTVRNFSLYFTWIFPWGPLVLDIAGQLGFFYILIKLRDPVISLTLVNSPAWERELINVLAVSHFSFFSGCPVSLCIRRSNSLARSLWRNKSHTSLLHPGTSLPGAKWVAA